MDIPVLPPHINESFGGFTCLSEKQGINVDQET